MKTEYQKLSPKDKLNYKVLLFAYRCDYITHTIGGNPITKKGMGYLNHRQWRFYFKVLCFFRPKYRNAMLHLLKQIANDPAQCN